MNTPKAPFMSFQDRTFYVRPSILDAPEETPEPRKGKTWDVPPIKGDIGYVKTRWHYGDRLVVAVKCVDTEFSRPSPFILNVGSLRKKYKTSQQRDRCEEPLVREYFGLTPNKNDLFRTQTALDDLIKPPRPTAKKSIFNTNLAKKQFEKELRLAKGSGKPASKKQLTACFAVLRDSLWDRYEKADLVDFCQAVTHSEPAGLSTHEMWAFNVLIRDLRVTSWIAGTLREYRS